MADTKKKILLVDDDSFILDMYSVKFQQGGYELDVAGDGKEALQKLEKNTYDIILLDIVMPALDGFELLEKMRKERIAQGTPVIILTNLGQKDDVDKGFALGADDFIVKAHLTPSEVLEKIERVFAKKKQ